MGSFLYEASRFVHQIALFKMLGVKSYGMIGTLFSIIYLTIHIADFESGSSLLPFLHSLKKSRPLFFRFITSYAIFNIALLKVAACAALLFSSTFLPGSTSIMKFVIFSLIVSEGIRMFLRFLLQTSFLAKQTVVTDLSLTMGYYLMVWIPVLLFQIPLSPLLLFGPYLLCSLCSVVVFSYFFIRFGFTLPATQESAPINIIRRIAKIRLLNHTTHISNQLFTGNFLAPLFALKFGLEYAGILKFASYLADSIKAIIKVSIGFSGSALLAHFKARSITIKRKVFRALWKTFNTVLYPIIIFLLINYKKVMLLFLATHQTAGRTIISGVLSHHILVLSFILLLISITEHFFVAYEEFYLLEEKVGILLLFKLFEFTLFYGIIIMAARQSAFATLLSAVIVRLISFSLLALHAYSRWKIAPTFAIKPRYIVVSFVISLLFYVV